MHNELSPCHHCAVEINFIFFNADGFLKNYLFICGCVLGFCCCHGLLLVAVSGAYSLVSVHRLLSAEHGLHGVQVLVVARYGLTSCGLWALECRLSSCVTCTHLPLKHVGSSGTRD